MHQRSRKTSSRNCLVDLYVHHTDLAFNIFKFFYFIPECGLKYTSNTGTFRSPQNKRGSCSWTIEVPTGYKVRLYFRSFRVGGRYESYVRIVVIITCSINSKCTNLILVISLGLGLGLGFRSGLWLIMVKHKSKSNPNLNPISWIKFVYLGFTAHGSISRTFLRPNRLSPLNHHFQRKHTK